VRECPPLLLKSFGMEKGKLPLVAFDYITLALSA